MNLAGIWLCNGVMKFNGKYMGFPIVTPILEGHVIQSNDLEYYIIPKLKEHIIQSTELIRYIPPVVHDEHVVQSTELQYYIIPVPHDERVVSSNGIRAGWLGG